MNRVGLPVLALCLKRELAGEVLLQPGADLVSEVVEGVVEPDVHSVRAYNPT